MKVIASVAISNSSFETEFTRAINLLEKSTYSIEKSIDRVFNILNRFENQVKLFMFSASISMVVMSGIALIKMFRKSGSQKP